MIVLIICAAPNVMIRETAVWYGWSANDSITPCPRTSNIAIRNTEQSPTVKMNDPIIFPICLNIFRHVLSIIFKPNPNL